MKIPKSLNKSNHTSGNEFINSLNGKDYKGEYIIFNREFFIKDSNIKLIPKINIENKNNIPSYEDSVFFKDIET